MNFYEGYDNEEDTARLLVLNLVIFLAKNIGETICLVYSPIQIYG